MRGPKPELQAIEGGLANVPKPPKTLCKVGADEWKRVAPVLVEQQTLSEHHLSQLENYCDAIARARECSEVIAREGMFITVPGGVAKKHPAVQSHQQYLEIARRLAGDLYISPFGQMKVKQANKRGSGDKQESRGSAPGVDI